MKLNKWLAIIFLLVTWYIPRQTAPGGLLDNYITLRWITFILIPVIFICFLLYRLRSNTKIHVANILFPIISIFVVIIFSGLINQSSLLEIAFTILIYLRYPLLFIVLLNMDIDKDVLRSFLKVFFFLVIIQIPEVFYRFFVMGIRWDHVSWTLGPWGHFDLGVYMIYAAALIVAKGLVIRTKLSHIILILCFFLVALMGEIKGFIFFAPVVTSLVIYNCFKKKITKKKIYITIGILIVIAVGFIFFINLYEKVFPESRALVVIFSNLKTGQLGKIGRVSAFLDIMSKVEKSPSNFLFGWGPGSSFAGNYLGSKGLIYEFPIHAKNQLAETFVDIGFMGILAYYWLLIRFLSIFKKQIKLEDDKDYIIVNNAIMGMWFFFAILGPMYDLVWRHDSPNFIFYFLTAVLYNRYRNIKNENSNNQ